MIEASDAWVTKAQAHFKQVGLSDRIKLLHATANPDNIETLLTQAAVPTRVDVLSIDIDSYDFWLWKAIDRISARLVVIEYNASFGPERSVTVPYTNDWKSISTYYHGASLTALVRLGKQKGYVFAGCDSKGVNAFFVRADLAAASGLELLTPAQAYFPHFLRTRKLSVEQQSQATLNMPLVQIKED